MVISGKTTLLNSSLLGEALNVYVVKVSPSNLIGTQYGHLLTSGLDILILIYRIHYYLTIFHIFISLAFFSSHFFPYVYVPAIFSACVTAHISALLNANKDSCGWTTYWLITQRVWQNGSQFTFLQMVAVIG